MIHALLKDIYEVQIQDIFPAITDLVIAPFEEVYSAQRYLLPIPHRIGYYQIIVITEGEGVIYIDSKKYNFDKQNLIAVRRGQIQGFEGVANVKGYIVMFSEESIYKQSDDLSRVDNLKLFDHNAQPVILKLADSEYVDLLIFLKKMRYEASKPDEYGQEPLTEHLLKSVLIFAERAKRGVMKESADNWGDRTLFEEFKKALEEQYQKKREVQDYAEILGVSSKKINKLTQQFLGKTAKRVIEERVILEITRLCLYSTKTLKEICYTLHFSDASNLNRLFKKYKQTTPIRFRLSANNTLNVQ